MFHELVEAPFETQKVIYLRESAVVYVIADCNLFEPLKFSEGLKFIELYVNKGSAPAVTKLLVPLARFCHWFIAVLLTTFIWSALSQTSILKA